ncbi:MAG: sigma 54-interacting transcriptional regulator, partial [Desulfobulbaceae bacterium]|nr:sigma 54-interacting transcriptional regulator [Desulfobulbaceae bacterium]
CGALPENLLESELFGHVRGAFTGAVRDKKGRFELADGGTIFLDEIGDISLAMQVKLLRVLQNGTFQRVGGEETIRVDVRVISATNKNLREEIEAGRFREDLFYRLCVVPVVIPPLRERRSDIPLLAHHFIKQIAAEEGRDELRLSPEAMDILLTHAWPGNIRELQNVIRYLMVRCREDVARPQHLPDNLLAGLTARSAAAAVSPRKRKKLTVASVRQSLAETGNNRLQAAKLLGVGRATLYRFLNANPGKF